MTTPIDLHKVWALIGGVTDPNERYEGGWQAEIPTFQNFNWVLKNLDLAKLAFAEADVYPWNDKIAYSAGARVREANRVWYCKQPHNDADGSNPQRPSEDTTNSYWVSGTVISSNENPYLNLKENEGIKVDEVNARSVVDKWEGNDVTINNLCNILALNSTSSAHDNLLFGNIRGEMVVINVGNTVEPDSRVIAPSEANKSYRVYHEGHKPTQVEVEGTIPKNPEDGKLYARRGANWVEVTTTTVNDVPPAPSVGAGASWYNLQDGRLYVDIFDGDTSQWVPASPPVVPELKARFVEYIDTHNVNATSVQTALDIALGRDVVVHPNLAANSNMYWWQRGSSTNFSASGVYWADRWIFSTIGGGTAKVTKATAANTDQFDGSRYAAAITYVSGTVNKVTLAQRLLEVESQSIVSGKKLTISFLVKTSDGASASVEAGISAAGDYNNYASFVNGVIAPAKSVANGERASFTFDIDSNVYTRGLQHLVSIVESNSNRTVYIANVKVEVSGAPTDFVAEDPLEAQARCYSHYYASVGTLSVGGSSGRDNITFPCMFWKTPSATKIHQGGSTGTTFSYGSRAGFRATNTSDVEDFKYIATANL